MPQTHASHRGQLDFPTFCHISEYDQEGYKSLRQMVATSAPITLWAPSSLFFTRGIAQISPIEFVELIRHRAIRILGRTEWLTDRDFRERNTSGWEGYAWDDSIDGAILAIYEYDEQKSAQDPKYQRRVMAAGPAPGPTRVGEIEELLTREDRKQLYEAVQSNELGLPPGVKQAAKRPNSTPETIVRSVLIDAVNHADAYRTSSARMPFFLDSPDSLFLKRLAPMLEDDSVERSAQSETGQRPEKDAEQQGSRADDYTRREISRAIAGQMLTLLRGLEERTPTNTPNLTRFLSSPGHGALVSWYRDLHDEYQLTGDTGRLDGALLRQLRNVVDREPGAAEVFKEIFSNPAAITLNGGSIALDILDVLGDPGAPRQMASIGITALSAGLDGLRALQWIPRPFQPRHWPYLYASGRRPKRWNVRKMRKVLKDLADGV
jgi:hypothetical protein